MRPGSIVSPLIESAKCNDRAALPSTSCGRPHRTRGSPGRRPRSSRAVPSRRSTGTPARIVHRPRRGNRPSLERSSVEEFAQWWTARQAARAEGRYRPASRASPGPGWLSSGAAAELLSVSVATIRRLYTRGVVSGELRANRLWLLETSLTELESERSRWISQQTAAQLTGASSLGRSGHRGMARGSEMNAAVEPDLLSVRAAARMLGLTPWTVYLLCGEGNHQLRPAAPGSFGVRGIVRPYATSCLAFSITHLTGPTVCRPSHAPVIDVAPIASPWCGDGASTPPPSRCEEPCAGLFSRRRTRKLHSGASRDPGVLRRRRP